MQGMRKGKDELKGKTELVNRLAEKQVWLPGEAPPEQASREIQSWSHPRLSLYYLYLVITMPTTKLLMGRKKDTILIFFFLKKKIGVKNCLGHWFSNFSVLELPEGHVKRDGWGWIPVSVSIGLGWDDVGKTWEFTFLNKLPGENDVAGLGTRLWEPVA